MPAPRPPFRPDLEGLRGLAVLLVVAYHAGVPGLGGGFVGVDVFFVLSGYFTARLLAREYAATGAIDVPGFYARRARRLLPALLLVLAATLALAWGLYAPIDRAAVATAARAAALGVSNHAFARDAVDYFGAGARSPLLHTWSLSVELQAALVWPLLFAGLAAFGARARDGGPGPVARRADGLLRGVAPGLAAVGVLSLGAALWLTRTAPGWAFFGSATRAWEFALGGLLALGLAEPPGAGAPAVKGGGPRRWLPAVGLGAVAAAVLAYTRATPYPGSAALLPALGAAALVAGGAGPVAVALGAGPLRALGRLSYGWYLWHWPLVVTGAVLDPTVGVAGRLAWSAAALGLAWLTLRWVERPFRSAPADAVPGGTRPRWAPVSGAVAACAALALAAAGLRASAERRAGRPDQRPFAAARRDGGDHACWNGRAAGADSGACVFGDRRAAATVALFGDSHAEHWLPALDRLGRARGFRVVAFVKGGCPVADAPELAMRRAPDRGRACARFREAAVRRIAALRPEAAVLSSYDAYVAEPGDRAGRANGIPARAWERGLTRTYTRLAAAGVPVVALRGTPTPGFDAPACLSRRAAGLPGAGACTYALAGARHAAAAAAQDAAVRAAAGRGLPVRLVDMGDRVCASARCAVARGGVVVFTDDNHLTAAFARGEAPVLGARMDAALASVRRRAPGTR
jgi:peptidoglycan/LPS O-acetylase OafA/YrhL